MKVFFIAFSFLFVGMSYSQTKPKVDTRLIENHGNEIYNIYEKQKSYYDFLLWELDHGYKIIEKDKINETLLPINNIKSSKGDLFNSSDLLNSPKSFNFYNYNFVRKKNSPTYYDLGNGKVLMFTSLTNVWVEFRNSKK